MKPPDQISIVCRIVMAHGMGRFDDRCAFAVLWPSKSLSWNRLAGCDARPYMAELVDVGLVVCAPGPRGGQGWAVAAAGMAKARGYAAKQRSGFQQQFERRIAASV